MNEDRVAAGGGVSDPSASRHGDHLLCRREEPCAPGQRRHVIGDQAGRRTADVRRHGRAPQRIQRERNGPRPLPAELDHSRAAGPRGRATSRRPLRPRRSAENSSLVGSPDGRDGSVVIRRDVDLYATLLEAGETVSRRVAAGRGVWVQVIDGALTVNGETLQPRRRKSRSARCGGAAYRGPGPGRGAPLRRQELLSNRIAEDWRLEAPPPRVPSVSDFATRGNVLSLKRPLQGRPVPFSREGLLDDQPQ